MRGRTVGAEAGGVWECSWNWRLRPSNRLGQGGECLLHALPATGSSGRKNEEPTRSSLLVLYQLIFPGTGRSMQLFHFYTKEV